MIMKSHKYDSYDEAVKFLKSKGQLKFWGRIGNMAEIHLYTINVDFNEYTVYVYEDGLVEIK